MTYYVTFRHRRLLDEWERSVLLGFLTKADGSRWDLMVACVLPAATQLILRSRTSRADGRPFELSAALESAKTKAGKRIIGKTEERFPPFYSESYDRIVRDEAELEQWWSEIVNSSVDEGLAGEPAAYSGLYVSMETQP